MEIIWLLVVCFFIYFFAIKPYADTFTKKGNTITRWFYEGSRWNGQRYKQEVQYRSGKIEGISKTFYPNGAIRYFDVYKHNQLVLRKAFDQDGRFLFEEDYEKLGVVELPVINKKDIKVESTREVKEKLSKMPKIDFEDEEEIDFWDKNNRT